MTDPTEEFENYLSSVAAGQEVLASMEPIRDTASGYRDQLIEDGWSEPEAERIAADLLISLTQRIFRL